METRRGIKITVLGLICAIVLTIGISVFLGASKSIKADAAETMHNPTLNVDEVRIDGWRAFRDMTTFGSNDDWGCGMTVMAILLQYYNDNSLYAGEILPDEFNYALGSDEISGLTTDKQVRANALRGYSLNDRHPDGYVIERNDDLFRLTPKIGSLISWTGIEHTENATIPTNHRDGLKNFFQMHCPDLNIGVNLNIVAEEHLNIAEAKSHIDNNRPILLTMLSYKDTYNGGSEKKDGKFHAVVVYGYREINGQTQFLAHSGWGAGTEKGTEVWFYPAGSTLFIYGFAYIDAPLDRFNTTTISNRSAVRIDGLKRNATGNLIIPSHLNGLPVTEIGSNAFSGQTGVTSITFANGSLVKTIGSSAFSGMTNLTNITLPGTLQTIGNNAFANCIALPQIEIPSSVTSIGSNAFANCINLADISFGESNLVNITSQPVEYKSTPSTPLYYTEMSLDIRLLAGATYTLSFDYKTFEATTARNNVYISLGIGETAFETVLPVNPPESSYYPNIVEGKRAITFTPVESSDKLWVRFIQTDTPEWVYIYISNVSLTCESQLKTIGSSAFSGCTSLSQISIPKSVTTLGNNAFKDCTSLTSLTIPASITSIGAGAFADCTSLTDFTVDSLNPNYISVDGVLYSKYNGSIGSTLVAYPLGKTETSFTVPNSVTEIAPHAINNNNLTVVNLNEVRTVRENNFTGCQNLATVTGPNVSYVGEYSFDGTGWIESFPNDFVSLGKVLLKYKGSDSDINLTYYSIRGYAFEGNQTLEKITFSDSVYYIGDYAFSGCSNLEKVILSVNGFVNCGVEPFDFNTSLEIIMPYDLLARYQADTFWANYVSNFVTPKSIVSFSSNGGSPVSGITAYYGKSDYLPQSEKTGYLHIGWRDSSGFVYKNSYALWDKLDGVVNLTAVWSAKTYEVILDNGDNVTFEIYCLYNEKFLFPQMIEKDGYIFGGYYTDIDGIRHWYYLNDVWDLDVGENATLRAVWKVDVKFYSDGVVLKEYTELEPGTIVSVPVSPKKTGFTFMGWYSGQNGAGTKLTGTSYQAYQNINFYANWECTISFNSNGGSAVSSIVVKENGKIMMPISTKAGYSVSWLLSGITYYPGNTYYVAGSVTFIAKWTEKTLAECYNGTTNAYEIVTYNQLNAIRTLSNSASGKTIRLFSDIYLTGNWTPIPFFSGTLDGNGYKINNLSITITTLSTYGNYGFFGVINSNGTIKNLTLSGDLSIDVKGYCGGEIRVGAFAGENNGNISNCKTLVTQASYLYSDAVNTVNYGGLGGIAGYNGSYGSITDCQNYLNIRGKCNIGGIAGRNDSVIKKCNNYANIVYVADSIQYAGQDNRSIGGIAGYQAGGSIASCINFGSISFNRTDMTTNNQLQPNMGQIIGYRYGGTCSGLGNVSTGYVNTGLLTTVGSWNQKLYAKNAEIGRG